MTGSAKIRANTNATSPPATPASTPRTISFHSTPGHPPGSVAGEAEEVPSVVHELVDVHVVPAQRHRALVNADEVVHRQGDERGDRQPQRRLRNRQHDRC